nr:hypothetical protein [Actinomyces qiguomingii]
MHSDAFSGRLRLQAGNVGAVAIPDDGRVYAGQDRRLLDGVEQAQESLQEVPVTGFSVVLPIGSSDSYVVGHRGERAGDITGGPGAEIALNERPDVCGRPALGRSRRHHVHP